MLEIGSMKCRLCLKLLDEFSGTHTLGTVCVRKNLTYFEILKQIINTRYQEYELICAECESDLIICYDFVKKLQQVEIEYQSTQDVKSIAGTSTEDHVETTLQVPATSESMQLDKTVKVEESKAARDPLEETDDEQVNRHISHGSPFAQCSDFDEDDNKPLKQLLKADIEEPQLKTLNSAQNYEADFNDPNVSTEEMIFPKGRYNCETCLRTYFTIVGLEAHMKIHSSNMPPRVRRRRKRASALTENPEKIPSTDNNSCSTQWIPQEADILPDSNPFMQENMNETAENIADSSNTAKKQTSRKNWKPKKIFPCNVCGKHMISASKLRYHMVMHTGEKNYLCSMCPKAYSTIYALKHHFRIHTNERPYVCNYCGDRFLRPTTLKSHVRRHTGERPYSCDICGKKFIQHSSMATHIKLNHLAKTIQCSYCDKKYARQTDLTTHLLSHTGEKKFQCQLCPNRRFIRQANLNKHMNQHHPEFAKQQKAESQKRLAVASAESMENLKDSKLLDS